VVVAPDLESGSSFVKDVLGVEPGPGGEHAKMGTHNRLLRLGDDTYLEVIAINPQAPAPGRRRWFGMDSKMERPTLTTWVARVDSLEKWRFGEAESMSRGALTWRLTVTPDGSLPMGGVAPALIEWPGRNPAHRLPPSGCELERLELFHPRPDAVEALLREIGFTGPVDVQRSHLAALTAHLRTPRGRCKLS
jgi:hypothetical protein